MGWVFIIKNNILTSFNTIVNFLLTNSFFCYKMISSYKGNNKGGKSTMFDWIKKNWANIDDAVMAIIDFFAKLLTKVGAWPLVD